MRLVVATEENRMNRRDAILAFIGLAIGSQASNAQQPRKVWRIGVLRPGNPIVRKADDGYVKAMSELGEESGSTDSDHWTFSK